MAEDELLDLAIQSQLNELYEKNLRLRNGEDKQEKPPQSVDSKGFMSLLKEQL